MPNLDRRGFLAWTGGALSFLAGSEVLALLPKPPEKSRENTDPKVDLGGAEAFGGFVLLHRGAALPSGVRSASRPAPEACLHGQTEDSEKAPILQYLQVPDAKALAALGGVPVYRLSRLPETVRPSGASAVIYTDGGLLEGFVTWEERDPDVDAWVETLTLTVRSDFPRPFPMIDEEARDASEIGLALRKVDFAPGGAGLLRLAGDGSALSWIANDVLYTLTKGSKVELTPAEAFREARELADRLELVA